jgi:hypothetical protein
MWPKCGATRAGRDGGSSGAQNGMDSFRFGADGGMIFRPAGPKLGAATASLNVPIAIVCRFSRIRVGARRTGAKKVRPVG